MSANSYDLGDIVKLCSYDPDDAATGFTNAAGVLTDPTTVTLIVNPENGTQETFTYAASQVTKDAVGRYSKNYTPTVAGRHFYRWQGTGAVAAAEEKRFNVRQPTVTLV